MRVWEKSAEAVVAKKAWKQVGAKGRRNRDTTARLSNEASSHLKSKGAVTAVASRRVVIGYAWWIRVEAKAANGKLSVGASERKLYRQGAKP